MPSDDQHNPSDSARKQLLEEIRKRAEEAEMNRLEEEDRTRTGRTDADRLKTKAPAPFPVPASETPAAGNKAATEQKILVIRERLQSALERGKSEKAAELFAELSKIIPDDPALAEFRVRLRALQEEKAKAREQTRPVSPSASRPDARHLWWRRRRRHRRHRSPLLPRRLQKTGQNGRSAAGRSAT